MNHPIRNPFSHEPSLGLGRILFFLLTTGALQAATLDVLIRNGTVYDGSGRPPVVADVALAGDQIVALGRLTNAQARLEIDATGLAVAPGFVNMLSWANESLLVDGRSLSDIRQGVTLEVLGEGMSMGPLNAAMQRDLVARQGDLKYDVAWTTLGEYLDHLVRQGVSCNVASFVGATTVRVHEIGYANRAPTAAELERMKALVRHAMREGALGLSSALIYAPAFYARTDELAALARVAGGHGGLYISHIRSEGARLLEALDEFLSVVRAARVRGEIYHLKAAGRANWPKLDAALARIETARAAGLPVTADMYCYTAAATGLDAAMPPWVQEGGFQAWVARLRQPAIRARVRQEMNVPATTWENFFHLAGSPTNILLTGFRSEALKPLTGKTLAEVARMRGRPPADTAMDLVIEDGSRVETVYFLMSEENLRKQLQKPWVSLGSDAASLAPQGVFLKASTHPRAYGNFARFLGHYVRDAQLMPLEEAVRRLTSLPAANLRLDRRGLLQPGHYADVVIFDAAAIRDHATYGRPHQLATGVEHVFVNGVQVLRAGVHTGARPGRVVRGPGYAGPGAR
jgi:N-acyl-D-amino-acid deacylase